MTPLIDDETLRAYLAETLPAESMARIEKALRESADLRARLEDVRHNRTDHTVHTLGAMWRRGRLSCPTRQQLGSFLLDALDPDYADYVQFHIRVIECPFCCANLADLQAKAERGTPQLQSRQKRFYHSSRHLLGGSDA